MLFGCLALKWSVIYSKNMIKRAFFPETNRQVISSNIWVLFFVDLLLHSKYTNTHTHTHTDTLEYLLKNLGNPPTLKIGECHWGSLDQNWWNTLKWLIRLIYGFFLAALAWCGCFQVQLGQLTPMLRIQLLGAVGSTNMNATSSRSHAIFTITIERSEKGLDSQQHLRMGKLHMVDLAVSVPIMCFTTMQSIVIRSIARFEL